jgi:hypothetical protein
VSARTSALHAEFARLAEEEARLRATADRIYRPLAYFESLVLIGKRLGVPVAPAEVAEVTHVMREMQRIQAAAAAGTTTTTAMTPAASSSPLSPSPPADVLPTPHKIRAIDLPLTPDDEEFPLALERLDECIAYLAAHPSFKDATRWLAHFKDLQARALASVRAAVADAVDKVAEGAAAELRAAAAAAAAAAASGASPPPSSLLASQDAVEMTQLQLRFRTELAPIRRLVRHVESRSHKRAFADILSECYRAYLDRRLSLMKGILHAKLARTADERTRSMRAPKKVARGDSGDGGSGGSSTPTGASSSSSRGGDGSGGASVYTSYTSGTTGTRVTSLWSEAVTAREACMVDAARTCAAMAARAAQAEHALFHALFTAPLPGSAGSSSSSSSSAAALAAAAVDRDALAAEEAAAMAGLGTPTKGMGARLPSSSGSVVTARTRATRATTAFGGTAMSSSSVLLGSAGGVPSHVRQAADASLSSMQEELCGALVDVLRPHVLGIRSLDVLCDVVTVLRDEVLGELAAPRGPTLAALGRVVAGFLGDVQERIVFRAQGFIAERIDGYTPASAASSSGGASSSSSAGGPTPDGKGVVTYPVLPPVPVAAEDGLTTGLVRAVRVCGEGDFLGRTLAYHLRARAAGAPAAGAGAGAAGDSASVLFSIEAPALYDAWCPVLESTLALLSKLYRAVEPASFDGIAADAVVACTTTLTRLARAIASDPSPYGAQEDAFARARLEFVDAAAAAAAAAPPPSGAAWTRGLAAGAVRVGDDAPLTARLDSSLFLIKNLLVLREQLSPFDIQLSSTTRSIDFSTTAEALGGLLSHLSTVFTLSRENGLLTLVSSGLPTVHEEKTDGRVQLEALLKGACESLIAQAVSALLGPVLPALSEAAGGKGAGGLAAALDAIAPRFPRTLAALRRRLGLYLGSAVTASILFRPVREQVAAALTRVAAEDAASGGGGGGGTGQGAAEGGEDGAAAASGETVGAKAAALLRVLEASDGLVTDPMSPGFGMD